MTKQEVQALLFAGALREVLSQTEHYVTGESSVAEDITYCARYNQELTYRFSGIAVFSKPPEQEYRFSGFTVVSSRGEILQSPYTILRTVGAQLRWALVGNGMFDYTHTYCGAVEKMLQHWSHFRDRTHSLQDLKELLR